MTNGVKKVRKGVDIFYKRILVLVVHLEHSASTLRSAEPEPVVAPLKARCILNLEQ